MLCFTLFVFLVNHRKWKDILKDISFGFFLNKEKLAEDIKSINY